MRRIKTGIVLAISAIALAGCGKTLSASNTPGQWPFTVDKVSIKCAKEDAVFVKADGKAYPLNGAAERRPDLYKSGELGDLNDITKPDPSLAKLLPCASRLRGSSARQAAAWPDCDPAW